MIKGEGRAEQPWEQFEEGFQVGNFKYLITFTYLFIDYVTYEEIESAMTVIKTTSLSQ